MKILIKIFTLVAVFFPPHISSASDESVECFSQFPNELKLHVFKQLPFGELRSAVPLTCKNWRACIQDRLDNAKILKEFTNTILNDASLENLHSNYPHLNAHFKYALSCLDQLQNAKKQFVPRDGSLQTKFILDPQELVMRLVKSELISTSEDIRGYEEVWEELKRKSPGSSNEFGLFITLAFYHKELEETKKLIQEYDLKTEKYDYFDMESDMQILQNGIAYKQWLTDSNQVYDFMIYSNKIIKQNIL